MAKKLLSLAITICICLSLFGNIPISAETDYNEYKYSYYTYTIAPGNIATITAVDPAISGNITIPDLPNSYGYDCPVVAIERGAFNRCDYLTEVTIPDTVTFIDSSAFFDCNNLTAINVSSQNGVYSSRDGVLFNKSGTTLIKYPDAKTDGDDPVFCEYTIPDDVTAIGDEAFQWCSFSSITIPDSVKSIGDLAFNECYALVEVIIGSGVTEINPSAFWGCNGLANIYVSSENEAYSSENGVLYNKDKTTLVKYPANNPSQSCTLPESIAVIGYSAFSDAWGLTIYYNGTKDEFYSITIENDNDAFLSADIVFTGCYTYTITNNQATIIAVDSSISGDITIPDTLGGYPVTEIGEFAFNYCTDLTDVTIPDGVTSIGVGAFSWCINLKSVTIPASVSYMANDVFNNCVSLTDISVSDENEYFSSCEGILFDKDKNKLIRYPIGKDSLSYTIPASVNSIGDNAFSECASLTNITFHNSVSFIGRYAFNNCSALLSIVIPSDVSIICSGAFSGCTSLIRLTIPYGVVCIEEYAFAACTSLENVTIPDSVQMIMSGAFTNCSSLTEITLPKSVTYIGSGTFDGTALDTIYFNGTETEFDSIESSSAGDHFYNANKIFFHYVRFDGLCAKIDNSLKGNKVILALYKDCQLADVEITTYDDDDNIGFNSTVDYDIAKVFVWGDLAAIQPEIKEITLTEQ